MAVDGWSVSYLQSKHPQTVVILLRYRHHGDLDALVGHSVLGPVLCTFLQDKTDPQWIFLPIKSSVYMSVYPSASSSSSSPRFSPPGWWSSLWLGSSPATPSSRSRPPCSPLDPGWRCTHTPHRHNPAHTHTHTDISSLVILCHLFLPTLRRRYWNYEVTWLKLQAPLGVKRCL